jgi:uncharacterized Zn-finger protein
MVSKVSIFSLILYFKSDLCEYLSPALHPSLQCNWSPVYIFFFSLCTNNVASQDFLHQKLFLLERNNKMALNFRSDEKRAAEVRPFPCDQCPKSFSTALSLQHHIRTHTGEKPYSCSQCSKSFAQSSTLRRHWKVHTDETSFRPTQFPPLMNNREQNRAAG